MNVKPRDLIFLALILLGTYVLLAVLLPPVFFSAIFSAIQLGFAVAVLLSWGPATLKAVRYPVLHGEHISLLGITLLACGAFYSAAWGISWNAFGQDPSWTGTGISTVGRALSATGFALMLAAPSEGPKYRVALKVWVVAVAAVVAVAGAFLAGVSL